MLAQRRASPDPLGCRRTHAAERVGLGRPADVVLRDEEITRRSPRARASARAPGAQRDRGTPCAAAGRKGSGRRAHARKAARSRTLPRLRRSVRSPGAESLRERTLYVASSRIVTLDTICVDTISRRRMRPAAIVVWSSTRRDDVRAASASRWASEFLDENCESWRSEHAAAPKTRVVRRTHDIARSV